MTLWEALWPQAEQAAQRMRFGTVRVSVTLHVREGRVVKVEDAQYAPHFSMTLEDLKMVDKRQALA